MNTQQTMHTLNAALFEYEENYFNCRNAQVVAYLRSKGVPVDYYFYNTLENTKTVYDHLFAKNQNRWLFETGCLSNQDDFKLLGVQIVDQRYPKFHSAKERIVQLLKGGTSIFSWLCNYYIPHREHYRKYRSFHSFIIHDCVPGKEAKFVVQDPPVFYGEMSEEMLVKSFNSAPGAARGMTYADLGGVHVDPKMLMDKYTEWLNGFSDDLVTYAVVKEQLPNQLQADQEKFKFFFAIMFGSRLLFSRFLEAMSFEMSLVQAAAECSGISESIHYVLKHSKWEDIDVDTMVRQITELAEKEKHLIHALKNKQL